MKGKLLLSLAVLTCCISINASAQFAPDTNGLRSDTINILRYTINLTVTDFTTDTLRGNTDVNFVPRMNNISTLSLDLLEMKIDSIMMNASKLTFTYNDTLIIINLPTVKNVGDTSDVIVYYHGKPQTETGGVGGFYFESPFAFNMGEAIDANPHTYGRAWYPCFDNFTERALYTFNITTTGGNIAYANGHLVKDTTIAGYRTRTWEIDSSLPAYLAAIDIAPYAQINETYIGSDTIPIVLAAIPADTAKMRASFIHLKNAISIYQKCYGKYEWNKVGYSEVGANGGSMEHATNIAYPQTLIDGYTTDEFIMAHELSHHWFGDLVTTWAASDMWLNEGFATYNQYIFEEYLYGDSTYHSWFRGDHEYDLHFGHIDDGHHFWPLSGIPSPYTFGTTTYTKGGQVVGTLRGYLGDSLFFNGLQYYLHTHMYQAVNTDTLEHSMERYTGLNLKDFFDDWVKAPGFPQFSIDSMTSVPSGPNYQVTLYIKQRLDNAPAYYNNVPLDVTFKSSPTHSNTQRIMVSGEHSTATLTVPIKPVFAALNLDEKISEAIAPDTLLISKPGLYNMTNSRFTITVTLLPDTAFLYFEHNFAPPDPVKDTSLHYRISTYRYWKFSGIFPAGFKATAKLYYDGTKTENIVNGVLTSYLDTDLTINTDDSIILLYRRSAAYDWKEFPAYTKHKVSTDLGYMLLDSVPPGEYAFANGVSTVLGVNKVQNTASSFTLYPNPASDKVTVNLTGLTGNESLSLYNIQGQLLRKFILQKGQSTYVLSTKDIDDGSYILTLYNKDKKVASRQVIVSH